jgi:cell division protein FtsB
MLRSRFIFEIAVPSLLMCWAAALIYGAAAGESGYGALAALKTELEAKRAELEAVQERRLALEKRAGQLSSKSLDPDLIDERIRSILGYSREGDVVISRSELERALEAQRRE